MNKIFILEPRAGLCNQLGCISLGILLGIMYNRDIYFDGFQLDYKNEEQLIDFKKIININALKTFVQKKGFHINILDALTTDNQHKVQNIYSERSSMIRDIKDIYSVLELKENQDAMILNIKNPISTYIHENMKSLYEDIKLNICFNEHFVNIADRIKKHFQLKNYCCIHLRMEDDAIDFMKRLLNKNNFELINDIYKQVYLSEIEKIVEKNVKYIYVCTSLNIYENKNNLFYEIIKKKYNLIDKSDILNKIQFEGIDMALNRRELYGIIDYIIAQDSLYFVGCDWSSFSLAIKNHHDSKNKSSNLLKIWKTCENAFQTK